MAGSLAFFSFAEVTDPERHRDYNAWHQLDHRPENLALPGVAHGERWVRAPDCARADAAPDDRLAGCHYVNMYWFGDPVDESVRAWQALAETSFQWGRRPELAWARRPLMGFFAPVRGYTSPRVLVSPAALPYRPAHGVVLTLWRLAEPHAVEAERAFERHDRERLPAALEDPGVAGVWTFSSAGTTFDAGWRERRGDTTFHPVAGDRGRLRLELVYCDGDPVQVAARLGERPEPPEPLEPLFASPLRTIAPWQWDWFDPRTSLT